PRPEDGKIPATVSNPVLTQADLAVTKTGPATAVAGTNFTYTITVTNNGPSDALGVIVTDNIPGGETFQGGGQSQGSRSVSGNVITWSFGTIASGASATAEMVVSTDEATEANGTMVTNSATANSNTACSNT